VKEMLQEKRKMVEHAEDDLPGNIQTRIVEVEKHLEATNTRIESLDEKLSKNDSWLKNEIIELKEGVGFLEKKIQEVYVRGSTGAPPPESVELQKTLFEVHVTEHMKPFKISDQTVRGKLMWLAKDGFFNTWKGQGEIMTALTERGWTLVRIIVYKALDSLVKDFFLGKRKAKQLQWKISPNVKFVE